MFYLFYFAVLLACPVFSCGEQWSDLQQEVENELLRTASLQNAAMDVYENSTWTMPYKCCMCKESLKAARFLIMNEIEMKIDNICSIIKSVREKCLKKAKIFEDNLMWALFPGGPYNICKTMKMCK